MLQINKELFVIPGAKRNDYMLYLPLKGVVLNVNEGVIKLLQNINKNRKPEESCKEIMKTLTDHNIIGSDEGIGAKKDAAKDEDYLPTDVTLMPTHDCNLRCRYCYSSAGEHRTGDLKLEVAKRAIDLIAANAKAKNKKIIRIHFHGGGEPFLRKNMKLIKETVRYAREIGKNYDLIPKISGTTNGIIDRSNLEWIAANLDSLNISIDGPEDIQNKQRPMAGGKPSFPKVMSAIAYLENKGFKLNLRATITKDSVHRMEEIIQFFDSISSNKTYHLESLFSCGRCKMNKIEASTPSEFSDSFVKAKDFARQLGVQIYASGADINKVSEYYCGAAGTNFIVTPTGNITSCVEVSREDDNRTEVFFIGRYDSSFGSFVLDDKKIQLLKSRTVKNMPNCKNCFAKYNCSGDCLTRTYAQSGCIFDSSKNDRCDFNRRILLSQIKELAQTNILKMEEK